MNIIKSLFLCTILFLFLTTRAMAQDTTYLSITQYESAKDHPVLIQNNEIIFEYYGNSEDESPVMLSVMTEAQRDTLLSKGFKIQLVEENPDMSVYRLLYNPLPYRASVLASYGKIYVLSKNHTLLKLSRDTDLNLTGNLAQFTVIPLQNIGSQSIPFMESTANQNVINELLPEESGTRLWGSIIIIILFIITTGVIIYRKLKKKQVS